jgi:hypothetical protein
VVLEPEPQQKRFQGIFVFAIAIVVVVVAFFFAFFVVSCFVLIRVGYGTVHLIGASRLDGR